MSVVGLYDGQVEVEFTATSHRYKVDGTPTIGVSTILGILNKDLMAWAAFMAAEAFKEAVAPFATTGDKMTKTALKTMADDSKKAHLRKSQRGKDVGTIVHELIAQKTDEYLKSGKWGFDTWRPEFEAATDEDRDAVLNCIANWIQWVADYQVEVVRHEFIVHSRKLGYCGTGDVLFRSNRTGKLYLGDYKTSEPSKQRNSRYQIIGHKPYPEHFCQITAYDYAQYEETGLVVDGYMAIYLPKEGQYQAFSRESPEEDRKGWEALFGAYKWIDKVKKDKA